MPKHWLFQCNPSVYAIFDDIEAGRPPDNWSVARYLTELEPGDDAVLWVAGNNSGIYGVGSVTGTPELGELGGEGWQRPEDEGREGWLCPLRIDS